MADPYPVSCHMHALIPKEMSGQNQLDKTADLPQVCLRRLTCYVHCIQQEQITSLMVVNRDWQAISWL